MVQGSRASHEKHEEQCSHAVQCVCIVLHTINRPDLEYNKRLVLPYPHDRSKIAWGPEQVLALIQSKNFDAIVSLVHRTSLIYKAA